MPLQAYYFSDIGVLHDGDETNSDGTITLTRTIIIPFERNRFCNPLGRLLGPKGRVVKWMRKKTGCDIIIHTNDVRFLKTDSKAVIKATDVPEKVHEKMRIALELVMKIANPNNPGNTYMSDYQLFHGEDEGAEDVEWLPENFNAVNSGPKPTGFLLELAEASAPVGPVSSSSQENLASSGSEAGTGSQMPPTRSFLPSAQSDPETVDDPTLDIPLSQYIPPRPMAPLQLGNYNTDPTPGLNPLPGVNRNCPLTGVRQQPNGFLQQPVGVRQQPTGFLQRPAGVLQQPTGFPQHPAEVRQQPNGFPQQPVGVRQQPTGFLQRPAGVRQQPTGFPQHPAGVLQQPNGFLQQPAGVRQQPTWMQPNGFLQQPAGVRQQPTWMQSNQPAMWNSGFPMSGYFQPMPGRETPIYNPLTGHLQPCNCFGCFF